MEEKNITIEQVLIAEAVVDQRARMLDIAVRTYAGTSHDHHDVIAAAKAYEDYLKGA